MKERLAAAKRSGPALVPNGHEAPVPEASVDCPGTRRPRRLDDDRAALRTTTA